MSQLMRCRALTPSTEHFRNKSLHPMHSACARLVLRARPADGARSAQKAWTPRAPMSSRQTQHCLPIRKSTVFWRQTQIEEPAKQKPQAHTHMCRITTHAHDAHTHTMFHCLPNVLVRNVKLPVGSGSMLKAFLRLYNCQCRHA